MVVAADPVAVNERLPLESGDRLTREEFHRRYCTRPDIRKADLIDGVVYVPSPARWNLHDRQQSIAVMWLNVYAAENPAVSVGISPTIFLPPDEEIQPDGVLFLLDVPNAKIRLTEKGYLDGTPDLVVEIAASTAAYDHHAKKNAYRRAGVDEYIVWTTYENRIDWFRLRDGEYVPLRPNRRGIIESETFPGLRLNVPAMLAGDRAAVLGTLRRRASRQRQ